MASFFDIINIRQWMTRKRKMYLQLENQYPKNTYDPLARREMKKVLTRFNDSFYHAYPMLVKDQVNQIKHYHPKTHDRNYDVQRAVKLCKAQKVRRKDIGEIEKYLNLQFIIEKQLDYYKNELQKAHHTKALLSEEVFSSFYPDLYNERIELLNSIENHCVVSVGKLGEEKRACEKAIHNLIHRNQSFWGSASRLIGSLMTDTLRNVVDIVDQSIKRKS